MDDKITNSIVLHQLTIKELEEIKENVAENIDDMVRFRIETRRIFRVWEPYISRIKNKLEVSPRTMILIIDGIIEDEKRKINKLIDMEVDQRIIMKRKLE